MLRIAVGFFVLALISMVLGANNIAGVSAEIGSMFLWIFLILAVLSFVANLFGRRGPPAP